MIAGGCTASGVGDLARYKPEGLVFNPPYPAIFAGDDSYHRRHTYSQQHHPSPNSRFAQFPPAASSAVADELATFRAARCIGGQAEQVEFTIAAMQMIPHAPAPQAQPEEDRPRDRGSESQYEQQGSEVHPTSNTHEILRSFTSPACSQTTRYAAADSTDSPVSCRPPQSTPRAGAGPTRPSLRA